MNGQIIRLDAQQRLVAKARAYISNAAESGHPPEAAIEVLYKAFKSADEDLKLNIILMLGALLRPQVVEPLYNLMHDEAESEFIRHAAAVQLSVLGAMLQETAQLTRQLIEDLRHPDAFVRFNAAFASGWEGNHAATDVLIERLDDEDIEVQQAAVNALGNLGDGRIFGLLAAKLWSGAREQKRTILYNLFRFTAHQHEAIETYRRFILNGDRSLRYDALTALHTLTGPQHHLSLYQHCLLDSDPHVRELALLHLLSAPPAELMALRRRILALTGDPLPRVRRAAIRVCHHIQPGIIVGAAST